MHWIIHFIIAHKSFCSLLLTLLLSLWMISGSPDMQARTARSLTMTLFYPVQLTINQVTRLNYIFSENKRLRLEVAETSTRLALLEEQGIENERLRRLVGFSLDFPYELLPARVIARDPSPLYRSVVVNAGRKHGVTLYMPLVSEYGVVGKVAQVTDHMSLVQLLKDPSNSTSVMDRRTRSVGILETKNGREFFVRYRSHEDVEPGDTIVTSGLGGIYPKGLLVGVVTKATDNYDPLFKTVYVKPSTDFNHLEETFVMMLPPQWSAFRSELDSLKMSND